MTTSADDTSSGIHPAFDRPLDEGVQICVEQIGRLRETPGLSGSDIMDIDPARYIEVVEAAGLTGPVMAAR